jgi:hypothetical protein
MMSLGLGLDIEHDKVLNVLMTNTAAAINRDFYAMTPGQADEIVADQYKILTANGAYYAKGRHAAWAKVQELLGTVTTWAQVVQNWDGQMVWSGKAA